jgi:hypothetical protein
MGYVDKSDHMANSYSISRQTWKWMKKLVFHRLYLTFLNTFIIFISFGAKLTYRDFRLTFLKDLIQDGRKVPDYYTGETNSFNKPTYMT